MADVKSPSLPFRLGCPVWNCQAWQGEVYPQRAGKNKWLHWYSRMFNTVEGNSTFYGLPSIDVAHRWVDETADGFRFSLKVPRAISHDARLVDCDSAWSDFLEFARVLHEGDRLGPSFLQLPPTFGVDQYTPLQRFIDRMPDDLPWAIELRHHDWFDQDFWETRVNHMLAHRGIDKVLFDSRPLYQSPPDDEIEATSQTRKPKTPIRQTVTGQRPMLRIVGRNRIELVERFLDQWIPIVRGWVASGLQPYIFTHAPDDAMAPKFARLFWRRFCDDPPAASKGEQEGSVNESRTNYRVDELPSLPKPPEQMEFF